ncbi:hypothetical protein K466DRAFT_304959 [Polyporus arcularius HHB13444]|uniref:Uncharacterized protein n=1 Tax=Polyporus arcularius HHB13444 TaxID=1314778 RepID=A0A5C3NYI5_9APHY|nr:hypothetical protein K466DRAFT_304959 [Polyporus arcularius HHB13444]
MTRRSETALLVQFCCPAPERSSPQQPEKYAGQEQTECTAERDTSQAQKHASPLPARHPQTTARSWCTHLRQVRPRTCRYLVFVRGLAEFLSARCRTAHHPFLDCLEHTGLSPIWEGQPAYASLQSPIQLEARGHLLPKGYR